MNSIARSLRWGTAGIALAVALVAGEGAALAQPSTTVPDQPSGEPATAAERPAGGPDIVVTGSRIRRDPLSQDQPVTFVDRADIDRTGLNSVADVLQRLPSSGGALNSRFNNSGNFGNPPDGGGVGAGAAEVDLRYLGSKRTLVLVDGLRYVNGASASGVPGSTDINSIPEAMIDRVEVLQDGASAIYGSDAISGVVNIITRKQQKGLRLSGQLGIFGQGDGASQNYQASWGMGSEESGTHLVVGANYVRQDSISSGDRAISLFPTPGTTACDSSCSSGTPLGRFIVLGQNLTLKGPVLTGRPRYDPLNPTGPNSDFKAFTTADRFNFAPFNFIQTPLERYGAFVNFSQDIGDKVQLALKGVWNRRNSKNQAAPLPLFVGPDAGNGNLLDTISIAASNPFNPFGVTLDATNYAFIGRRFVENGPRRYNQRVDTWYVSGTLSGSFQLGAGDWYWDVNGVYGRNKADQTVFGNVNAANLARALGPVAACTAGCVPFNIFGGAGSITQQMIDYVTFTQRDSSRQTLWDFSANLSGELFQLPGGPAGIAVGVEHRDQSGRFDPDPIVAAGLGSDIPALPTAGSYNVDEAFAELRLPLLKGTPFFDRLELTGAARFSDYSTTGSTTTFKAGVDWAPVHDLLFRGSWAEGFRAPTIGELFGTPSRFDQEIVDPCSAIGGQIPAAVRTNCIASGVPANGSYVQANPQLPVITGGNRNLAPETSESWVVGAVYSPSFVPRLSLEANYFNIKVDGAIQAIDANVLLGRCAANGDAFSCAAITRTASGAIAQIRGLLQNIAGIATEGVDVTLNYRTGETGAGRFGLFWASTFLINYDVTVPATAGTTKISREGTEQGSPDQAFPKFKSTAVLDWTRAEFGASLTGRYISGVDEANGNRLNHRLYTDIQLRWEGDELGGFGFALGVNNLFNRPPPACFSCGLNNMDPTTYDVPGRFFYARATYKM
ncbi:MAG: TonB-dependent receptor [Alphaproteobacteria bacterium]|nr:TonB-dependent receptor [Alphaproteobacteria bacterium]MBV9370996.1 TonB-dependent receptor [Alphaproteobacteria bacterium]MBV9899539.1 TonB-dependent receptor [Alphaproteobacteria bacterium]